MNRALWLVMALLPMPLALAAAIDEPDWSKQEVSVRHLRGGTYLLVALGGNVVASIGSGDTLIVDAQFAPMADKLVERIEEVGGSPPRIVVSTHWHYDHVHANSSFKARGAVVVAHENVRKRMSTRQEIAEIGMTFEAKPPGALPVVTYRERMSLHMAGNDVTLVHVPNAHTDGDTLVKLGQDNVLHMGDVYNTTGYPYIETESGGTIDGLIMALELGIAISDDATIVVPGHGETSDRNGLMAYLQMLQEVRLEVATQKRSGRNLEQVIDSLPTAMHDERHARGHITPRKLVKYIYDTLP